MGEISASLNNEGKCKDRLSQTSLISNFSHLSWSGELGMLQPYLRMLLYLQMHQFWQEITTKQHKL